MNFSSTVLTCLVAGSVVTLAKAAPPAAPARLSSSYGEVSVLASSDTRYPYSGRSATHYKLVDAKGGLGALTVDEKGQPVEAAALAAAERKARRAAVGALDEALVVRLKAASIEPIAVTIWLAGEMPPPPKRYDAQGAPIAADDIDRHLAAVDAERAERIAALVVPVLERVRVYDAKASSGAPAPAVYARLSADALRALAADPAIDRIYIDPKHRSELAVAKQTTRADIVQQSGLSGRGVRVGMVEVDAGIVEPNSLLLRPVVRDALGVCLNTVSDHATSVASAIVGRRFTLWGTSAGEDGVAPNVELRSGGSCTGQGNELQAAATRAADWGARAINLSWGSDTALMLGADDRFFDDLVFNRWRTVVKSAGNENCTLNGNPATGNVTSPGLAYNVLTVGGLDHRGTSTLADNLVYNCSSFRNPSSRHNDRQKPDVAAPAANLTLVVGGPANTRVWSGTSFAAPQVTAATALLIERHSRLAMWPEMVRALLMATAHQNVEGASRLSDIDGAGGVDVQAAADLLLAPDRFGGVHYGCSNVPTTMPLGTVSASPRTRHRIVLAWSSDPSHPDWALQPSADIDLSVVDANGATVATSASWDNSFEIVEFDAPSGGLFTVRAQRYRCDRDTWLGWAWDTQPAPRTK